MNRRSAVLLALLAVAAFTAGLLGRAHSADAASHARAQSRGAFLPNDPGATAGPGGWARLQWNFAGANGVDAPGAWANLEQVGAPGGAGVTVAVLDTGVAYSDSAPFRRSPDLGAETFVPGYDFADDDPDPFDAHGHGTFIASTIAEQTDNGYGLTGLAYGVRIMPVRVLGRLGGGDAATIARGVRYAVDHGAKVINLSLNFSPDVTAQYLPELVDAVEYAYGRGSLVVAAAGNDGGQPVEYPARIPQVLSVGSTTEHGCLSSFSNRGLGLDLVAPGGGRDARLRGDRACRPGTPGRPIYQVGMVSGRVDRFGISGRYVGTSMAAAHVSATAALVVASGVLGVDPPPAAIEARLEQTARDLGRPGYDNRYGWGLVDAGAATAPAASVASG